MRYTVIVLSWLGLLLTVAPSFLVLYGQISWRFHTQLLFAGMLLWFVCAPLWIGKRHPAGQAGQS